ncbi:MAG: hypothetical protein LC664_10600 [Flavobacteriales bacterium]|nr:hypothetical protein [Flavobacteriales bacterium]
MDTSETIRRYFTSKQRQLIAASAQAVIDHNSLKGAFRESLIDIYLKDLLPKRYSIGKGMVYGRNSKSNECDIVIWDSHNHPSISMNTHSIFFAESVKAIFEIKTNWSKKELKDIVIKSKKVKTIKRLHKENLYHELRYLQNALHAIMDNDDSKLAFTVNPDSIPVAAFVFKGGHKFDPRKIQDLSHIHEDWPDFIFFLEIGKVLIKEYSPSKENPLEGQGFLRLYEMKERALLMFTSHFSEHLFNKSVSTEVPSFLHDYLIGLYTKTKVVQIEFPCSYIPGAWH